jgi:tetratricopeptide (TPR) repeat protein
VYTIVDEDMRMPEKKTKEQTKNEIADIFNQLLAKASGHTEDGDSEDGANTPDDDTQDLTESQAQNLVMEGRGEITRGRFAASLKFFNQALELDPQCWDAWSAMGDALMEMGKIDQASICYKKAMASTFQLSDDPDENEDDVTETKEKDWQDYLMSFLEPKKEVPEKNSNDHDKTKAIKKKVLRKVKKRKAVKQNLSENEEIKKLQTPKDSVHFPCPACGSDVELDSGMCSQCQTIFNEEKFDNYESMDDDLVFFGRIKALLGKEERFFIHFNGEDGSIRFLDKKETSRTKKPSYVFVSANIDQLGFDYSASSTKRPELKDIEAEIEED